MKCGCPRKIPAFISLMKIKDRLDLGKQSRPGRCACLVVERRTPEREVGGSILTQVAMLYP